MVTQSFNHNAAHITVRICTELPGGDTTTGTGFFFLASVTLREGIVRHKLLLISNKHVLTQGKGKVTLTLNKKHDDGTPSYGDTITFIYDGFIDKYFEHSDNDVDLACVDISDITHTNAYIMNMPAEFLTPIDYEKVALGNDVLFIGYPFGLYDNVNNLPLVRKGTLASMPNIDFGGKGVILIDAQVFEGSSGSPVFVDWDEKYRLLGVISGTMKGHALSGSPVVLGLGVVVKQRHVQELMDHVSNEIKQAWEIIR